MEYWVYSCSIWLKNNTVHGINQPWIEKTSTEDLTNCEFDKMRFHLANPKEGKVLLRILIWEVWLLSGLRFYPLNSFTSVHLPGRF